MADSALLSDVQKNHFPQPMAVLEKWITQFTAFAGESHAWTARMAETILASSGLPPFLSSRATAGYIMHNRLAVFVYNRLLGLSAPALRIDSASSQWGLHGDDATLAWGSKEEIEKLASELNALLEAEAPRGRELLDKRDSVAESFRAVLAELDFVIASRRLRKRCDLVPFL